MGREARLTVKWLVVGLLMVATLFVYAASGPAVLMPHTTMSQLATELDDPTATVGTVSDHERGDEQALCDGHPPLSDGLCCRVAHCATLHPSLLAGSVMIVIPRLGRERHTPTLVSPEGVGTVPALRPPL
ncbi:hypothetical protein [Azospirillum agricola]|uniref:hypothetical protein n=1 Tax=Azospirillum agricola TaxID=1720247 RepID=UPI000A0EEB4D|nr:hypothetical protein [Azospirillum agricola]SMH61520.1 hypothetical protein SAMN02982994_5879 [Azospirillum lipoferum]